MATLQENPIVVSPRETQERSSRAPSQTSPPGRGGYHSESDTPRKGGDNGKGRAQDERGSWTRSSKGGAKGTQRFTPGVCNWCAQNKRPNDHYWSHCQYRHEFFNRRDGRARGPRGKGPDRQARPTNSWQSGPPKPKAAAESAMVAPVGTGILPSRPHDVASSRSSLA